MHVVENTVMMLAMLLPATYLAGSVNFPILLFSMLGRDDPRYHFSGNAGATNVYRQAGLWWAGVVLLLDLGRAVVVSGAALDLLPKQYVPWVGLVLVLGNHFPCFHQFRGGKGVASYLGFTALLSPVSAMISALVWLMAYGIVRIPFIASFFMMAVLMVGTIIACGYHPSATAGTIATALFIFYNHEQNIMDLFSSSHSDKRG
ncbi:MAG: glycerol-3-phosphate acyltransferase [Deltaproteobacteria bacterium]|nr:glycerol-3-phosphate acyltransferase [Deltaproteobacteria bacterium]